MNEPFFTMSERLVQVIGLTCRPASDPSLNGRPMARQPVAAAIVTLRQRNDGHLEVLAERMSDLRPAEFPLLHLLERGLAPGATTIVTPADRATLALDAARRRYFLEPRIAAVVRGDRAVDPTTPLLALGTDEVALCRSLSIPIDDASDADTERLARKEMMHLVEERALARAISRLMLWSHATAFAVAEPALFFEPMLALRAWLCDQAEQAPTVATWAHCRPMMWAASHAGRHRANLVRRLAGEEVGWTEFRDGLFHV